MIQGNEIRIGNKFLGVDDKEWTIDEQNFTFSIAEVKHSRLKAISITLELMNEKVFAYHRKGNRYYLNNQQTYILYRVVKQFFLCEQNVLKSGFHEIKKIETLHQLQNLYFYLTGEELEIQKPIVVCI